MVARARRTSYTRRPPQAGHTRRPPRAVRRPRPASDWYQPVRSRNPETLHLDEQQVDRALCLTPECLEFALLAADAVAWQWDPVTDRVIHSPNAHLLLGFPPGQAPHTGTEFFSLVHPEDRARVLGAVRRATAEGAGYDEEFRLVRPDGSIVWVVDKGRALPGEAGQPACMRGVILDITESRRAEEALRTSEERFQAFMANSPAIAWILDLEGRFVFVSPPFLRMIFVGEGDPVGKTMFEIFPEELAREYERNNRLAISENRVVETIEPGLRADGSTGHFLIYKFPIRGAAGDVLLGGVALDITDRYNAEEAQREADRRKDEFLATLAHELRNPLAPIQNAVHVLCMRELGDPKLSGACAVVKRQVQQLTRLIDDLLDVSRISRGKLELRRERIDLARVVECALETSRPLLTAAGHRYSVALPARPLFVDGDPTRLAQVLANLLNNAAKYTPPGGSIELAVEQDGAGALVHVRDDGIGIPPEMLDRIFDMFVQADTSLGRPHGGLGIGLTLVRSLVEMHGGQVTAASAGPGRGSQFTVRLPLAEGSRPAAGEPASGTAAPPPCRILVADDNNDAADTLAMMLELMGHEVHVAYDGIQAVREAEKFSPAVVFLDIGMPGMDGYEVARRLRRSPATRDAFLVAVTGWGQESDRRRSREAGFDHHAVKPLELAELERLLAAALSERR